MLPLRVVTNFVISSLRNFDRMQPLGARGGLVMQGELVDINDTRRKRQREFPTPNIRPFGSKQVQDLEIMICCHMHGCGPPTR